MTRLTPAHDLQGAARPPDLAAAAQWVSKPVYFFVMLLFQVSR